MHRALTATLVVAMLAAGAPADAQFGHRKPAANNGGAPQQVNCDAIAANPNIGMDRATCESMNQAAAAYNAAQNDPAGARPGDDDMTCDAIKAELRGQPWVAPPSEHVAQAQANARDFQAKAAVVQAHAAAAEATLTAESTAASAVGMANPIAGRAADQAVAAHQAATEAALNAEAHATVMPAQQKMLSSTGTLMSDMAPQLQNNPRMAHLIQMANAKHCRGS